jgi:hypothetical protein
MIRKICILLLALPLLSIAPLPAVPTIYWTRIAVQTRATGAGLHVRDGECAPDPADRRPDRLSRSARCARSAALAIARRWWPSWPTARPRCRPRRARIVRSTRSAVRHEIRCPGWSRRRRRGRCRQSDRRAVARGRRECLLALVLRYGLTVLPWLLAALFTWRYWYWKRIALLYDQIAAAEQSHRQRLGAALWEKDRALERRPQQRKRATPMIVSDEHHGAGHRGAAPLLVCAPREEDHADRLARALARLPLPMLALAASYGVYSFARCSCLTWLRSCRRPHSS